MSAAVVMIPLIVKYILKTWPYNSHYVKHHVDITLVALENMGIPIPVDAQKCLSKIDAATARRCHAASIHLVKYYMADLHPSKIEALGDPKAIQHYLNTGDDKYLIYLTDLTDKL